MPRVGVPPWWTLTRTPEGTWTRRRGALTPGWLPQSRKAISVTSTASAIEINPRVSSGRKMRVTTALLLSIWPPGRQSRRGDCRGSAASALGRGGEARAMIPERAGRCPLYCGRDCAAQSRRSDVRGPGVSHGLPRASAAGEPLRLAAARELLGQRERLDAGLGRWPAAGGCRIG